jgi:exodeoxyribonuclease-5
MNWGPQQSRALAEVAAWLKDPSQQVYTLFGYAGTGKTTLAQHLAATSDGLTLFAAYTGKAASVLRQKGCAGASTLHSLLYEVSEHAKEELNRLLEELNELPKDAPSIERRELEGMIVDERRRIARPRFSRNDASQVQNASLVVLDECSMVNSQLAYDLLSFKKKVLVLGDPAQLPPVKGGGFFTNKTPDLLLTEIHRQALDNPIVRWATEIREGRSVPYGDEGAARKIRKEDISMRDLALLGAQLLTGKNETRRKLNTACRTALGYTGAYPKKGERLVILRNDRNAGVLNGVTCETLDEAVYDTEFMDGSFGMRLAYEGREIEVEMDCQHFDAYGDPKIGELPDGSYDRGTIPADFGYALTVHKSQGSQWDHVALCDDGFAKWDPTMRKRWMYTAVTRAAKQLLIVGG